MKKLNVLLIDDQPSLWFRQSTKDVVLGKELEEHFNLYWLRNINQCRYFLDLFGALASSTPKELNASNLVPDIVIFDYALTQDSNKHKQKKRSRSDLVSKLQDLAIDAGLSLPPISTELSTGYERGADKFGCFVGGIVARMLNDTPCGFIPTTAASSIPLSDDAVFFEWLNAGYFGDLFDKKTRTRPVKFDLIGLGAQQCRNRFETLSKNGLIVPNLDDLFTLGRGNLDLSDAQIRFSSRYGPKAYRLNSLFIDVDTDRRAEEIAKWMTSLRVAVFGDLNPQDIEWAKKRAQQYIQSYDCEEAQNREHLRKLLIKDALTSQDKIDFDKLCYNHSLDPNEYYKVPKLYKLPKPTMPPIWTGTPSKQAARWAVLITCALIEVTSPRNFLSLGEANDQHGDYLPSVAMNETQRQMAQSIFDPLPERLSKKPSSKMSQTFGKFDLRLTSVYKITESNRFIEKGIIEGEGQVLRRIAIESGLLQADMPDWLRYAP